MKAWKTENKVARYEEVMHLNSTGRHRTKGKVTREGGEEKRTEALYFMLLRVRQTFHTYRWRQL